MGQVLLLVVWPVGRLLLPSVFGLLGEKMTRIKSAALWRTRAQADDDRRRPSMASGSWTNERSRLGTAAGDARRRLLSRAAGKHHKRHTQVRLAGHKIDENTW